MTALSAATEDSVVIACEGEHLLGIVSRPPTGSRVSTIGAVIVVGGPQYRAGSHRQFVHWARALAAAGTPTLRFDVRGMGDSTGELRHFTELDADIGAAIGAFQQACPEVSRVVLCGLCDGASAASLYVHSRSDPRAAGLVLLNPWVRSEHSQARTLVKHYYLRRLTSRAFWAKLLRGQVARDAWRELLGHVRAAGRIHAPAATAPSYQIRMAEALQSTAAPVLLLLSADDHTAKEFLEHAAIDAAWGGILRRPGLQRIDLPDADHTLSTTAHRLQLEAACVAWFAQLESAAST